MSLETSGIFVSLVLFKNIVSEPLYVMFSAPLASRCYSHGRVETDEEFDARWVMYFSKPDIDAWELRKGTFVLFKYLLMMCPRSVVNSVVHVMVIVGVSLKSVDKRIHSVKS